MRNTINKLLREIERERDIEILWAVESGSRAWGMSSKNSDYDVRFVFKYKPRDYFKVKAKDDIIAKHFDKDGNPMKQEGCMIDMTGFEVHKFVRMLSKSNPTCIEWLASNETYLTFENGTYFMSNYQPEELKDWIRDNFNPRALYCHYKSMCKQNYLKYIRSSDEVTYKKYLYAMRGLMYAKHVAYYGNLPSIDFWTFLFSLKTMINLNINQGTKPWVTFPLKVNEVFDINIVNDLLEMIELKKSGKEKDIVKNYVKLDSYIEKFLKDDSDLPESKQPSETSTLDKYLCTTILT